MYLVERSSFFSLAIVTRYAATLRAGGKEGYTFGDVSRAVAQDGQCGCEVTRTLRNNPHRKTAATELRIRGLCNHWNKPWSVLFGGVWCCVW
eukprot:584581-Amphidinium_carterae.1